MSKMQYLLKKYSPFILTTLGAIGTVTTTVLAVKATPKALKLINNEENSRNEYLSNIEKVKIAWKPYIPAIISEIATITCIYGAHFLNRKSQASLISAYAFLDNSYKEYVAKTKELYGNDADSNIRKSIADDKNSEKHLLKENNQLFFDYETLRYFESTINNVLKAENQLNQEFAANGLVTLNDFYKLLGLDPVDFGNEIGWYDEGEYYEIEFEHQKITMDDGLECHSIDFITAPNMLPFISRY